MKKLILLIAALSLTACNQPAETSETTPTPPEAVQIIETEVAAEIEEEEAPTTKTFSTNSLENADPFFNFRAQIPPEWEVEYVPKALAINIYDPNDPAETTLEKSQIFIKYFRASQFLTLNTVTIFTETEASTNDRPTVIYDIKKNPGVANFYGQPLWRNQRHKVTDIHSTDETPTTFYVFGQNPNLPDNIFQEFLDSVEFNPSSSVYYPIENFTTGITQKPFGILIDPETSPIQPERFSGYHTGTDIEYENSNTVTAISDGVIKSKRHADGYGGLLTILHEIDGEQYTAIYGHLRLSSIFDQIGDSIQGGQSIGTLGNAFSGDTDGERQHLHFALLPGDQSNISGYVKTESELNSWIDPEKFLTEKDALVVESSTHTL